VKLARPHCSVKLEAFLRELFDQGGIKLVLSKENR
jgi:hypothetical protein